MKREVVRTETTITEEGKCYASDFKDGRRNHESRNAGGLKAGKDKGMDSPLDLTEGRQSC